MSRSSLGKPKVGLLMGDPCGIGPELVAKVFSDEKRDPNVDLIVIGDKRILLHAIKQLDLNFNLQVRDELTEFDPEDPAIPFLSAPVTDVDLDTLPVGTANEIGGRYTMEVLSLALDLAAEGKIDAVAYAPMNKKAMNQAGWKYRDGIDFCTSHLQHEGTFSELNVLDGLWVARVTSHVPMRNVWQHLTTDRIHAIIELLHRSLSSIGIENPRIAVAGYNPHCGEGGLCGTEEVDAIIPAIERANADGIKVEGPFSADIVYVEARNKNFDGIVTMYHDQCQIANKLLEFERGIAIHGGSPVPTVTTGHGTAFDIVGQGKANHTPLVRAVSIAGMIANNDRMYTSCGSWGSLKEAP